MWEVGIFLEPPYWNTVDSALELAVYSNKLVSCCGLVGSGQMREKGGEAARG